MLLLDSEAFSAIALGPPARLDRIRALVAEMRRRDLPIAIVAAVLAELVRGTHGGAGVFAGLRRERVRVHSVDSRVAVRAGQLLSSLGVGSEVAVDAFIVAAGDLQGGALIAKGDPDDLRALAMHAHGVEVADIGG